MLVANAESFRFGVVIVPRVGIAAFETNGSARTVRVVEAKTGGGEESIDVVCC